MSTDFTPPPMPGYGPPVPPPPPVPPRKSRTALIAVAAAVVAAAVSALITVGVGGDAEAEPAPTVTVTETAAADADGARAEDDDAAAADEEATDSEDGGQDEDGVYALDDTAVYEPATEVALSGFKRSVTGEYAEPENTPYLQFTVKVKNGGKKALDITQLTVNCSYGKDGKSSDSVFDSDAGLEGGPETKLLPGRSLNVPWGCELPKGEKLIQIEVSPDFESDAAIFTGTVK